MANSTTPKCGTCGGLTEAKPVDTSLLPSGTTVQVGSCTCPPTVQVQQTVPLAKTCCPTTQTCPTTVSACEEDHTQQVVINNFTTVVKTVNGFNWPAVSQSTEVKLASVQSLIVGQILFNASLGRLHVIGWNPITMTVKLENRDDSCVAIPAQPGDFVPSCTEFAVGIPECNIGAGGQAGTSPFLAADFVGPANGSCALAKVTTVTGLAVNDVISIQGFQYRINDILDSETIELCNDGDGAPTGQVIEWDPNGDDVPDVPVIVISSQNPCQRDPVTCGNLVVCAENDVLTTMQGSFSGQVPVWDQDQEKFCLIGANLKNECTALTVCLTVDAGDDGPYLATVLDTSLFEPNDQIRIGGDLFYVVDIVDGTHMHVEPQVTPPAIKDYPVGTEVCLRDCCEFLPDIVDPDNTAANCGILGTLRLQSGIVNVSDGTLDLITDWAPASRYVENPNSPFDLFEYTNNTECNQILEVHASVLFMMKMRRDGADPNDPQIAALVQATLMNNAAAVSGGRYVQYFDSRRRNSQSAPDNKFLDFNAGFQFLNCSAGHIFWDIGLTPGQSADIDLAHVISFDDANDPPVQVMGENLETTLNVRARWRVYRGG